MLLRCDDEVNRSELSDEQLNNNSASSPVSADSPVVTPGAGTGVRSVPLRTLESHPGLLSLVPAPVSTTQNVNIHKRNSVLFKNNKIKTKL